MVGSGGFRGLGCLRATLCWRRVLDPRLRQHLRSPSELTHLYQMARSERNNRTNSTMFTPASTQLHSYLVLNLARFYLPYQYHRFL